MSVTATDPTLEFLGLYADQTEDVILARWMDWANEGLDPVADADEWSDTREGGHWRTPITPVLREFARIYDLIGYEVPMVAFVLWAWGTYLDDLAATYDVQRLAATPATGREQFSGPDGTVIAMGTTVGTVPANDTDTPPTFEVTEAGTISGGVVDVPIAASEPGAAGNVAAGAITVPSTPLPAGVTFTNANPTVDGTDPESDDRLRSRVLQALKGKGPGTVADYVRWLSAIAGVGSVQVVPTWRGAGTVLGMITDPDGLPLDSALVTLAQEEIDPVAGQGAGIAPIGAQATVETSVTTTINVVAPSAVFAQGYSEAGTGGTIAVLPLVRAALAAYLRTVAPGASVVHSVVAGIVATTPGVVDAPTVQVNGGTANVTLALDPPAAAVLGTVVLH